MDVDRLMAYIRVFNQNPKNMFILAMGDYPAIKKTSTGKIHLSQEEKIEVENKAEVHKEEIRKRYFNAFFSNEKFFLDFQNAHVVESIENYADLFRAIREVTL